MPATRFKKVDQFVTGYTVQPSRKSIACRFKALNAVLKSEIHPRKDVFRVMRIRQSIIKIAEQPLLIYYPQVAERRFIPCLLNAISCFSSSVIVPSSADIGQFLFDSFGLRSRASTKGKIPLLILCRLNEPAYILQWSPPKDHCRFDLSQYCLPKDFVPLH